MSAAKGKRQQLLWRALSVIVTVALLYFVVDELQGIDLRDMLSRVALSSWLLALLAYLLLNLFRAARFRVLLDRNDAPWRLLVPITLYHNGLVRVVPFKLGELSYVLLLRRRLNYSMQEGVGSLFGARVLELLIIVLVFAVGILLSGDQFAEQRDGYLLLVLAIFAISLAGLYFAGDLIRMVHQHGAASAAGCRSRRLVSDRELRQAGNAGGGVRPHPQGAALLLCAVHQLLHLFLLLPDELRIAAGHGHGSGAARCHQRRQPGACSARHFPFR